MSKSRMVGERFEHTLVNIAARVREKPDDIHGLGVAVEEVAAMCGGDLRTAAVVAIRAFALARGQAEEAIAALRAVKAQIEERPQLAWVLSPAFDVPLRTGTRRMIYTARIGRDISGVQVSAVAAGDSNGNGNGNGNGSAKVEVPPPLSMGLVDASGSFFLGVAAVPPMLPCEEHTALAANPKTEWEGVGEVLVSDTMERRMVLYCRKAVAERVAELLAAGDSVVVRSEGGIVSRIVKESAGANPPWLEFLEPDGPSLGDLVLPSWLKAAWERDFRRLLAGSTFWVGLIGPTGTGKTEAVKRFAREAGSRSGKRAALIHISIAHVGSVYYSETEREILRAFKRASMLAKEGCAVTILFDEVDSLLGDSKGRFEGNVDRRVRLTVQEVSGELGPGVAVYATMNARSDSWLPTPLARRFEWRKYPRPTRGQMMRVAGLYATPEALKRLKVAAEEFAGRVADFLYNDRFLVGRVHFHSGHTLDIHARDLHVCSPGKLKALLAAFCDEVAADGHSVTLETLWEWIERDLCAADINDHNVFDVTFLTRPAHETVSHVELLAPGR